MTEPRKPWRVERSIGARAHSRRARAGGWRRGGRWPARLAVTCLAALAAAGCAERPPDVLLVTVDTLRPDHLSVYGYARRTTPELERLFADGTAFERAYATTSFTSASTASLLSGLDPPQHGVRLFDQLFPEDLTLLPDLLAGSHTRAAFVSNPVLSDAATGLARRFDHYDGRTPEVTPVRSIERPARDTTDAVLRWLPEADPERPLFLWVHYMDPHTPYTPPPAHEGRYRFERPSGLVLRGDPPDGSEERRAPRYYVDRYDEEIRYVDAEVGRLVDGFAQRRDLDRTLFVFTADHGESLIERFVWFAHAYQVFEEQIRIPLLMRGPGVASERRPEPVSLIDVTATVLATVGRDGASQALPGVDLRSRRPAPDRVLFAESNPGLTGLQWRAAIRGDDKAVIAVREETAPMPVERRRYDLGADPKELEPLPFDAESDLARKLLAHVAADPDPAGQPEDARRGTLAHDHEELLKRLGYVQE